MKPNQRFIAGAKCPGCDQLDCLLIDTQDQSIECVDCGFTQTAEQRDQQHAKQATDSAPIKVAPKKVNISDIIRVNNIKE